MSILDTMSLETFATREYQGDLSIGLEPDGMAWSPVSVNQP
ncbi:MAG TPA: hypothetical protein VIC02_07965 [Kineobactrum sp.]